MYHLEAVYHTSGKFVVGTLAATKFYTCKGNRGVANGDEVHGCRNLTEYLMKILIGRGEFFVLCQEEIVLHCAQFCYRAEVHSGKFPTRRRPTSFCLCALRNARRVL